MDFLPNLGGLDQSLPLKQTDVENERFVSITPQSSRILKGDEFLGRSPSVESVEGGSSARKLKVWKRKLKLEKADNSKTDLLVSLKRKGDGGDSGQSLKRSRAMPEINLNVGWLKSFWQRQLDSPALTNEHNLLECSRSGQSSSIPFVV